jgi:hypothetical protein
MTVGNTLAYYATATTTAINDLNNYTFINLARYLRMLNTFNSEGITENVGAKCTKMPTIHRVGKVPSAHSISARNAVGPKHLKQRSLTEGEDSV